MKEKRLMREEQAAEFLDTSVKTLQKRRHFGLPPDFIRFGRKAVRYDAADLERFISECRVTHKAMNGEVK